MQFVNRAELVLAPKQPFVDWVNQLGDTPASTVARYPIELVSQRPARFPRLNVLKTRVP